MAHLLRRRPRSTVLALPVALALALSSCGDEAKQEKAGGGGSAAAAAKLVKQASGPNPAARSGRIDGELELTLEGNPDYAEPFSFSVSGPFHQREGSELPDYELELGARDYGLTLISARGRSYAVLGTTGYELPGRIRDRLVRKAARGDNGLTRTLEQFGIAPWRWEKDLRIAGTERIGGVATTHIATGFYVGRQLMDANTLLALLSSLGVTRAVGLPDRVTRRARRAVVAGAAKSRMGGSWIGVEDKVYRQSGFKLDFSIPKVERARLGGLSGGTAVGKLTVSEVGEPQRIEAPRTVDPFASFELALDVIGDAQEAESGR